MEHERNYDQKTRPQKPVKTLEQIAREAAQRDRDNPAFTPFIPKHHQIFLDMLQRAGNFAAKTSRLVIGLPRHKRPSPDKFKV